MIHKKYYRQLIIIFLIFTFIPFLRAESFTDLKSEDNELYNSHIQKLYEQNLITGYKNQKGVKTGQFGPGDKISRAAFAKMVVTPRLAEEYGISQGWSTSTNEQIEKSIDELLLPYYNCTNYVCSENKLSNDPSCSNVSNICSSIGGNEFLDVSPKSRWCDHESTGDRACEPWYSQFVYYAVKQGYVQGYDVSPPRFGPGDEIVRLHALKMIMSDYGNIDGVTDARYQRLYNLALSRDSHTPKCLKGAENYILYNNGGEDVNSKRLLEYALLADRLDFFGNDCQFFSDHFAETPQQRASLLQQPLLRKEAARFLAIASDYDLINPNPATDSTINTAGENSDSVASKEDYVVKSYEQALEDGDINTAPPADNQSSASNCSDADPSCEGFDDLASDPGGGIVVIASGGTTGLVWKETGSGYDASRGYYAPITGGIAYKTDQYGQFEVSDVFYTLHENLSNQQGLTQLNAYGSYDTGSWTPLGFPTSSRYKITSPVTGATAYLQNFQGGIIYWSGRSGDAAQLMKKAGQSPYGTDGYYFNIPSGIIYKEHRDGTKKDYNAYFVETEINIVHSLANGTWGSYGFPKQDPRVVDGIWRQDFENGYIDGAREDGFSVDDLASVTKYGRCCPDKVKDKNCKQIVFVDYFISEIRHDDPNGLNEKWHEATTDKHIIPSQCWVPMTDIRDGYWNEFSEGGFRLDKKYNAVGGYFETVDLNAYSDVPYPYIVKRNKTSFIPFTLEFENADSSRSNGNNTYILIHGWTSSPDAWPRSMATTIKNNIDRNAQFIFINWSDIVSDANDKWPPPTYASTWIDSVARETKNALNEWGIKKENTVIIGHSLGTLLGRDLDKKLGGVADAIYLDPADDGPLEDYTINIYGGYFPGFENTGKCVVAEGSWAGSEKQLNTCKERYIVDYNGGGVLSEQHNWVHKTYNYLIAHPFSKIHLLHPFNNSLYSSLPFNDTDFDGLVRSLHGILFTEDAQPEQIKYLLTISNSNADYYTLYGNGANNAIECNRDKKCIVYSGLGSDSFKHFTINQDSTIKDFNIASDRIYFKKESRNWRPLYGAQNGIPYVSTAIGVDTETGFYVNIESKIFLEGSTDNASTQYSVDMVNNWIDIASNPNYYSPVLVQDNPVIIE